MAKQYTPNDMRSNAKNPTSSAHAADRANRISQGHPNVPPPPPGSRAPSVAPKQPPPKK